MKNNHNSTFNWLYLVFGPVFAIVTFLVTFFLDPLNFGSQQPLAVMPAFLFSIVVLQINQSLNTNQEIKKTSEYSNRIYDAVKNYLHVITIGSPEKAMEYIVTHLPSLREVNNTSFNLLGEEERAKEKLYATETYDKASIKIASFTSKNLIWKDVGDHLAVSRFRYIYKLAVERAKKSKSLYNYKLINHNEPQINFIILEYKNGDKEVLFNWDFRGIGQDPIVLLSRESKIIEMFAIQFAHLWRRASNDHDKDAIKSTSTK